MKAERTSVSTQTGFTLLEVLVAMVVAGIALIAALGLLADCIRFTSRLRDSAESSLERWNRVQELRCGIEAGPEEVEWFMPAEGFPPLRRYRLVDQSGRNLEVLRYDGSAPAGE